MHADDFGRNIHDEAYQAAVDDTEAILRRPPEERLGPDWLMMSEWYNALSPEDRGVVSAIVRLAAGAALFDTLVILDQGASSGEDWFSVITSDGERLEGPKGQLHESFRAMLDSAEQQ